MDLNYLFFRRQIERWRAETAPSDAARAAHADMASAYETRIGLLADGDAIPALTAEPAVSLSAETARER